MEPCSNDSSLLSSRTLTGLLAMTITATLIGCGSNDKSSVDVEEALKSASSLESYLKLGYVSEGEIAYSTRDEVTAVDAAEASVDGDSSDSSTDYSSTNTQEAGVDEADLVKQNGQYLYAVKQKLPSWLDGNNTSPSIETWSTASQPVSSEYQGSTELEGAYSVEGLYLTDSNLVALTQSYMDADVEKYYGSDEMAIDAYYEPWFWQSYVTDVRALDTENPALPEQFAQLSIEGHLLSSRVVDGQLYMATKFTPDYSYMDYSLEENLQTLIDAPLTDFLPRIWVNGEQSGYLFEDGVCHLPDLEDGGYVSLVALVRVNLDDLTDWEAVCNSGRITGVYASTDAFIMTGYNDINWDSTRIDWYSFDDLSLVATGSVPGTLDGAMPSFRLSEKNGDLRVLTSSRNWGWWDVVLEASDDAVSVVVDEAASDSSADQVTTDTVATDSTSEELVSNSDWSHRLFVLRPNEEKELDLVSQLPNDNRTEVIGKPGESVRSVRFFNDRAYVVTFLQTDPLYVINLSDHSDPYVEGELEITGFSAYLHPISDSLLLGIGYEADEEGRTQGVKLSLFNTVDAANPTEISSYGLGGMGSSADVMWDHHAISFLETDSGVRLAMTWNHYEVEGYYYEWLGEKVFVADIDTAEQTLTERLNMNYRDPGDEYQYNYWYYYEYSRVPLQGEGLHLVINGDVTSGDISDWSADL